MNEQNKIDWDAWKCRCSALGNIMTNPQTKADKEAGNLSQTTKTFLLKEYIRVKYGREKEIESKYLTKGLNVEEDNITLLSRNKKRFFKKNTEKLENKWIKGTPDVFEGEVILNAIGIIDAKSSWDIYTFYDAVLDMVTGGINPMYKWQGTGYMDLSGAKWFKLCYGLINTPYALIEQEKSRLLYKFGGHLALEGNQVAGEAYLKACEEIDRLMNYDDIPIDEKIIEIHIDRNNDEIEMVHKKVEKCREYLKYLDATLRPAILASYMKQLPETAQ